MLRGRRSAAEAKKASVPSRAAGAQALDKRRLEAWFGKYKAQSGKIEGAGIQALCDDVGISPLDPVILVVACRCQAERMGEFTFAEFSQGMSKLGCDDAEKLKAKLDELREQLRDPYACKEIYSFSYQFSREPGVRSVPVEVCIELWKLLLPGFFALLDDWLAFVESKEKGTINFDTWMMIWDLATRVKHDLADYDEDSSWPVLLDEFVEHVRTKRNMGG